MQRRRRQLVGDRRAWHAALALPLALGACQRTDPGPGPMRPAVVLGETGLSPGQFAYPRCLDGAGDTLWVIDKQARVQRVRASDGAVVDSWRMPEWSNGKPTGMALWTPAVPGAHEFLVVADTHYHRVMVYRVPRAHAVGHELVGSVGEFGEGPGQFIFPTDVAVLASSDGTRARRAYVSEYGGNDRVSVFDLPDGLEGPWVFAKAFGEFGVEDEREGAFFNRPQSLDIVGDELLVADACNHRVGRFSLEGELRAWIGSARRVGRAPGELNYPYALVGVGDGTVLVSEYGNCRVQRLSLRDGAPLGVWGSPGRREGELATPWGLARLGRRVFVLDSGNDRIVGFDVAQLPESPRAGLALGKAGAR